MKPEDQELNNNGEPQEESIIDELMEGEWAAKPAPEPDADPEPEEGQPEPEPEGGEEELKEEGGEPEPEAEPKPEPDATVKTWEYRGKQYTLDQMVELGILDDAIQTARQFPTIQQKYQQILEERKAGEAQPEQPPEQQAPAGPSADQILQSYTPEFSRMAEQGYIEPEVYEAFPKLATSLLFHRDLIYDLRNAVQFMINREAERENVSARTQFQVYLDGICDQTAREGDHFALLGDQSVRKDFYQYLGSLEVPAKQVDAEFVRRQWMAFNSDAVLEAARQTAGERKAKDAEKRRNAKGEGSGPRPAAAKPVPKGEDAALIDMLLEESWPTGG